MTRPGPGCQHCGMSEWVALPRDELLDLVRRIRSPRGLTEAEHEQLLARFCDGVPDPNASDLVYWPQTRGFDHDLSDEEIVDTALAYRAIEL